MVQIPASIGDYLVLPISIPPTPAYQISTTHHIYLRQHAPKIPTPDDSRSLFLVNTPVDSTEAHFRSIFTSLVGAGRFESISFEDEKDVHSTTGLPRLPNQSADKKLSKGKKRKRAAAESDERDTELPQTWDRSLRRSGGTAIVVLVDEASVNAVLKAVKKLHKPGKEAQKYPIWGHDVSEAQTSKLGSARYAAHHALRYPDPVSLQSSIEAFMAAFNAREEAALRHAKRLRNVPDEDGFVTVTRGGGRAGPARREEAEEKRREMEEKEEKKRREMGDFYRFQMRERRKAEQGELVKRFEEDRRRVEAMKEKRGRFRPES
ncbi:ribosomal RNA-processing protein 7-domain-containing protein [Xylogone sp. PMI_703]|nr:ribosomal RNA-processing protein 7-domain-containing protein [Xylogone sp. PMI_703]